MSRPNYVVLLGLPLEPEEQDTERLNELLKQRKLAWNKDREHPRKGLQMQQNLELWPEMHAVMLDPEQRRQEYAAARQQRQATKDAAFHKLDAMLASQSNPSSLSPEVLALLCQKLPELTEFEIRNRLSSPTQAEPVKEAHDKSPTPDSPPQQSKVQPDQARASSAAPPPTNTASSSQFKISWWKPVVGIVAIVAIVWRLNPGTPKNPQPAIPQQEQVSQTATTASQPETTTTSQPENQPKEPNVEDTVSQDIEDAQAKVTEFLQCWEQKDLVAVEFLLHNDFKGEGGVSKWKWLDLRKEEASRTKHRQITVGDMQTSIDGQYATISYTQTYVDEFYDGEIYRSELKAQVKLMKWSDDQQWYLIKINYSQ